MQNDRMLRRWRRVDEPGLELMALSRGPSGLSVRSTLIHAGAESVGLRYRWELDPSWRTRTLHIERTDAVEKSLAIERTGDTSWRVDGEARPDLSGCHEVDLSATPFCNTLAIRRFGNAAGEWLALFVEASVLTCQPSRQRYEPLGPRAWRYVDKGVSDGFTAQLDLDEEGLVEKYEHLFEAF
ncbi:MAG: putative glycolipid-binding domain-containing protein [Reyranella sp.]